MMYSNIVFELVRLVLRISLRTEIFTTFCMKFLCFNIFLLFHEVNIMGHDSRTLVLRNRSYFVAAWSALYNLVQQKTSYI